MILKNLKRPVYMPVFGANTPVWDSPAVLIRFSYLRKRGLSLTPFNRNKVVIMCESGGLSNEHPNNQEECLILQRKAKPHLILTLDYPLKKLGYNKAYCKKCGRIQTKSSNMKCICGGPLADKLTDEIKSKRVELTIKNARIAMKNRTYFINNYHWDFDLVGVIQSYDEESLEYCTTQLYKMGFKYFAYGSRSELIERLQIIREIIGEDSWLHLLGISDMSLLKKIKQAGIRYDSMDSSTCMVQAINGRVIMPSGESRKIEESKYARLNDTKEIAKINFQNLTYAIKMLYN